MKLIKRSEMAANAQHHWLSTYRDCNGNWKYSPDKETIYNRLVALGPNPNADDVDNAIGNGSWTWLQCNECGSAVEECVQVGQEPDYDSATAQICIKCMKKALKLIRGDK